MAANGVSINIHDHGIIYDEQKRTVQCNYCGKVVNTFNRLKYHLGGIRGEVSPCNNVPADVKESMKRKVLEKKNGHLTNEVGELSYPDLPLKRIWNNGDHQSQQETAHQVYESSVAKRVRLDHSGTRSVSLPNGSEDLSTRHFQKGVGRFFFETGTDFHAVKSPSFQSMMKACGHIGNYEIPTCQDLEGWILQDAVKEMQTYFNEMRKSWEFTGCSILLDGWTDGKGRELVNILVDCPTGVIYLQSCDISSFLGDVDALQLFFEEILEEVGLDNVVQIVTYCVSVPMEMVGKKLMDKHKMLFWAVSASHCIELMLERFSKMDAIKVVLEKTKTITKFVHGREELLEVSGGLVMPSRFTFAMAFLTLENMVSKKENLVRIFASLDSTNSIWASDIEGKRVSEIIRNRSFWTGVTVVLKAAAPLIRVLELLNEGVMDQQSVGYIYETMDQAKETIKEKFNNKKSQYLPFWEYIDDIWNTYLYSPLHTAGYFLNPAFFYSSDFYTDAEVAGGFLCCIVKMAKSQHVQDLISFQVDDYQKAKGGFGQGCSPNSRSNVPPANWWSIYGGECPELQKLAIRILSQTCDGALKYGLKRDLAEQLTTKGRNPVDQQKINDLAFVHYNLHLKNFVSETHNGIVLDEINPMDEWVVHTKLPEKPVSEIGQPSDRGVGSSSFQPKKEI